MAVDEDVHDFIEKHIEECTNEAELAQLFDDGIKKGVYELTGRWPLINKERRVEIGTVRGVAYGRMDSKIGCVVGEYKKPSLLKGTSKQDETREQLKGYLEGLNGSKPLLAYMTDGKFCEIFRHEGGKIVAVEHKGELDARALKIILDAASGAYYELNPENLVKALCSSKHGRLAQVFAQKLFAVLHLKKNDSATRRDFIDPWMALFRLSHDDKRTYQRDTQEMEVQLAEFMDCNFNDSIDQHLALLCIQTAYAAVIKLTAYLALTHKMGSDVDFHDISRLGSEEFYKTLRDINSGHNFPGFPNLMEDDSFNWYSEKEFESDDVVASMKDIIKEMARFKPVILDVGEKSRIDDLFHKFYMELIPSKVRHSLGEYFTPPWLAEHVIESALKQLNDSVRLNWKSLDPTCGSGTFLQTMVSCIREEEHHKEQPNLIRESVLNRISGFDLNPISVLAARVNLYLALESISQEPLDSCEIPVFLLDSAILRDTKNINGKKYTVLTHSVLSEGEKITTEKILIDQSIAAKSGAIYEFKMKCITAINSNMADSLKKFDGDLSGSNLKGIGQYLAEMLTESPAKAKVALSMLLNQARAHNIGRQHMIVGNPPWVDWRNLPPGYREHIKQLCIDQHLFSGDGRTGGNNLNICGLLSNVAGKNWLHDEGAMALLMPSNLMFQTSYEGWRNLTLDNHKSMYIQEVISWRRASNPFVGIGQKFNTYVFTKKTADYSKGIPFIEMIKKKGKRSWKWQYDNGKAKRWSEVKDDFQESSLQTGRVDDRSTRFWVAQDKLELAKFAKMAGASQYRSREGLELYPEELLLWKVTHKTNKNGLITVENFQGKRSKIKTPPFTRQVEAKLVHPVVKGPNVKRFGLTTLEYVAALPYEKGERAPISKEELLDLAPNLLSFYSEPDHDKILKKGTDTTMRTVGAKNATESYAIGRVGTYTYSENFVVLRDNTKLVACAVTGAQNTSWGGKRPYICQNHAPYISQDINGVDISADEAHYLAAILNAPIVVRFVESSNDGRSFEVRMLETLRVDQYDPSNKYHKQLMNLSKAAHANPSKESLVKIAPQLDATYLASCDQRNSSDSDASEAK